MKKRIIALSFALFSFGIMNVIYGQTAPDAKIVNWYNGKNPGMKTEKAYASLKNTTSTTVVVAVIDSGIDVEHKDLQGKIWVYAGSGNRGGGPELNTMEVLEWKNPK